MCEQQAGKERGMGGAVKTETHSTVNKYASLETNKRKSEGHKTLARMVSYMPTLIHSAAST
jgi:hypothetical protein